MRVRGISITAATVLASATIAHAVDLTLSPASSLVAAPVKGVSSVDLAPPEGVEVTPMRSRPAYEVVGGRPVGTSARLPDLGPLPQFNPVSVSYCASETM